MTLTLRIADANFTHYVDRSVPYLDQASGLWLFGTNQAESLLNRAPNAEVGSAAIVGPGTPTYGQGFIEFATPGTTVGSAINTGITPVAAAPYTFISIARANANDALCGTWHSGTNAHCLGVASNVPFAATTGGNSIQMTGRSINAASMQFFASTRGAAGRSVYMHDGASMQSQSAAAFPGGNTNTYRIGPYQAGLVNQATTAIFRHAANMLFPTELSAGQIQELYDYFKFRLPKRGVVLL